MKKVLRAQFIVAGVRVQEKAVHFIQRQYRIGHKQQRIDDLDRRNAGHR